MDSETYLLKLYPADLYIQLAEFRQLNDINAMWFYTMWW